MRPAQHETNDDHFNAKNYMIHGRHFEDINKQEKISFRVTNPVVVNYMEKKLDITKPTLGTRGFFSRATGSFVSSGADTRFKT